MTRATSRRQKQINICLTQEEYERIRDAAHGVALSMSSYVRRKALRNAASDIRAGKREVVESEGATAPVITSS